MGKKRGVTMLIDLVKMNRSYRGFDEQRIISKEELMELVDYTRFTASSVNAQPLKYCLVCEKVQVEKIQELTKWGRALPHLELPHKGKRPTGFIVICQDTTIGESLARYQKDIGIAAQTILLAAVEHGLGGCMIGNFNAGHVKKQLDLREEIIPVLIVAIGKPEEEIVLAEAEPGGDISYYRDENDVHYVPKRRLEDIIL